MSALVFSGNKGWRRSMGSFTRELAWAYLLTFLAWLIGMLLVIFRYAGQEVVVTPAQGIGLAAMFAASAVISRTAYILTRESGEPTRLGPFGSYNIRFVLLVAVRGWALLFGAGVPGAIRAIVRRP
jgi:hypothetical protein